MKWPLVAIVLLMMSAAAWNQNAGDAARSGQIDLPAGPWDVTHHYDVLPSDDEAFFSVVPQSVLPTNFGPVGVSRNLETDNCTIVRIVDVVTGATERTPTGTTGCWLAAYDPVNELILVCRADVAQATDLRAYNLPSMSLAWQVDAMDVGFSPQVQEDPLFGSDVGIACVAPALDDSRAVVPWLATRAAGDLVAHRIASIDLESGDLLWSTSIPTWKQIPNPATTEACSSNAVAPACADVSGANWGPLMATISSSGIAVVGVSFCPDAPACDDVRNDAFAPVRISTALLFEEGSPAVGVPVGLYGAGMPDDRTFRASNQLPQCDPCDLGNLWSLAVEGDFYSLMGGYVYVLEPYQGLVRMVPVDYPGMNAGHFGMPGIIPFEDDFLLAIGDRVSSIKASTGEQNWNWPGYGSKWTVATFDRAINSNELHLAATRIPIDTLSENPPMYELIPQEVRHLVMDPTTGRLLQAIPGPGEGLATDEPLLGLQGPVANPNPDADDFRLQIYWTNHPAFVPVGDAFLRIHPFGYTARLEPASGPPPALSVNTMFPQTERDFTLQFGRADWPNATAVLMNWGEDALPPIPWPDSVSTMNVTHVYSQSLTQQGARRIEVLAGVQFADNTTRTQALHIFVDGKPSQGEHLEEWQFSRHKMYPKATQSFDVHVPPFPANLRAGLAELIVDWDVTKETGFQHIPWNGSGLRILHAYPQNATVSASFTAVFLDGTSFTASKEFFVGGAPADAQTYLQKRFSAENQEVTFFVLGLCITLIGALIAIFAKWNARRRIRAELRRLHRISDIAPIEPEQALRQLADMRADINKSLLTGRITEGQIQLLEDRIRQIVSRIQTRILEPVTARASPQLMSLTTLSLRDNRLEPAEHASLMQALAAEKGLTTEDRERFRILIDAAIERA